MTNPISPNNVLLLCPRVASTDKATYNRIHDFFAANDFHQGNTPMTNSYQELRSKLRLFAQAREWQQFHSPKNLACALSVEASELLEHFQWMPDEESRQLSPEKRDAVALEMADIFCYLLHLSAQLDIDLIAATSRKIDINEERYPVEKAKGNNKKYSEHQQ